MLDDDLSTYIEMHIRHSKDDWYQPDGHGRYTHDYYPVRYCTQDDFGHDENGLKLFAAWGGITILCPDIDDLGKLYLMGDTGSMIAHHL